MGENQSKPSAAHAAEIKKMVVVTTANDLRKTDTEYDIEADRLLDQLADVVEQGSRPLIDCTAEALYVNKNEKINEEVLKRSPIFSKRVLPHDKLVKLWGTHQTLMMREGITATKKQEDTTSKMKHVQYLFSNLKTVAWHSTHDLAVLDQSLIDAERLEKEAEQLGGALMEVLDLTQEIQSLLSTEELDAVDAEIVARREAVTTPLTNAANSTDPVIQSLQKGGAF